MYARHTAAASPGSPSPIREDIVKKSGDKWSTSPDTLVTNGPFKVAEMVSNDHITVVPNPNYSGTKPALKSIVFQVVNDGAAALGILAQDPPDFEAAQVLAHPRLVLAEDDGHAFSLELVPRISRAQSMDALSSQAAAAACTAG